MIMYLCIPYLLLKSFFVSWGYLVHSKEAVQQVACGFNGAFEHHVYWRPMLRKLHRRLSVRARIAITTLSTAKL